MLGIRTRLHCFLVLGSACSWACTGGDRTFVAWPAELSPLSFLVRHQDDQVLQTLGPFEVDGQGRPIAPLELTLGDEEQLTLVSLAVASLQLQSSHLVLDPLTDLRLDRAPEDCEHSFQDGRELIRLRLLDPSLFPLGDSTLSVSATQALLDGLAIHIPYDSTASCSDGPVPRLRRFSPDETTPPDGAVIDGTARDSANPDHDWLYFSPRGIAWLDESRLVLATSQYLYRLTEGVAFDAGPANTHRISPPRLPIPGVGGWNAVRIEVDPRTIVSDNDVVLVTYGLDRASSETSIGGAIWRYTFDATGLVNAHNLGETPSPAGSIAIDEQGRFLAGGSDGLAYYGTVDEGILEVLTLGAARRDVTISVRKNQTTFGAAFYALTDLGGVFVLKLDGTEVVAFEAVSVPDFGSEARGFELRPVGEVGPELWVGTYRSGVHRREVSGAWNRIPIQADATLAACAATTPVCGRPTIEAFSPSIVARPDGLVLLGPRSCSAAVLLEPKTGCIDAVHEASATTGFAAWGDLFGLVAVSRSSRVAFWGGARTLFVLEE